MSLSAQFAIATKINLADDLPTGCFNAQVIASTLTQYPIDQKSWDDDIVQLILNV